MGFGIDDSEIAVSELKTGSLPIHGRLYRWTENSFPFFLHLGVTGLVFEPHPANFENLYIFLKMFK